MSLCRQKAVRHVTPKWRRNKSNEDKNSTWRNIKLSTAFQDYNKETITKHWTLFSGDIA